MGMRLLAGDRDSVASSSLVHRNHGGLVEVRSAHGPSTQSRFTPLCFRRDSLPDPCAYLPLHFPRHISYMD